MEAVKFIKEHQRMCDKTSCHNCLAFDKLDCCDLDTNNPELLVQIVEQWSEEHPQKTIMQDFFEKFPNAPRTVDGLPFPCPFECGYSKNNNCPFGKNNPSDDCSKCWFRLLEN